MQKYRVTVTVLLFVGLSAGLLGCRSAGRKATPQKQTSIAYQPGPSSGGMPPPPGTWVEPVSPNPGMVSPGAYVPEPMDPIVHEEPMPVAPSNSVTLARIQAANESNRRARAELDALRDEVRRLDEAIAPPAGPAAPVIVEAPPAVSRASSAEARAARFAEALRSSTQGEVEQSGSRVVLRMSDAFQPGSERLKADPKLRTALLGTATTLSQNPGAHVEIVGHSDGDKIRKSGGKWTDNAHLSRERAQTVAHILSQNGVATSRIRVDGRGNAEPLVFPERNAQDKARNRRVEVHVLF